MEVGKFGGGSRKNAHCKDYASFNCGLEVVQGSLGFQISRLIVSVVQGRIYCFTDRHHDKLKSLLSRLRLHMGFLSFSVIAADFWGAFNENDL